MESKKQIGKLSLIFSIAAVVLSFLFIFTDWMFSAVVGSYSAAAVVIGAVFMALTVLGIIATIISAVWAIINVVRKTEAKLWRPIVALCLLLLIPLILWIVPTVFMFFVAR